MICVMVIWLFKILLWAISVPFLGSSFPIEDLLLDWDPEVYNLASLQQARLLERDASDDEILHTLKHMKHNKSPGPDGFNVHFFIHTWEIFGRRIGDNILLAQVLFRNYHRPYGPAKCAIKINLRKAFDSVSWDFLLSALKLFNFPPKFLYWIKACITTTSFSVKVNGAPCGYFKGAKGLRQGDPLSRYLFVIVMEVLSLMLSKASKDPAFRFHWKTAPISLTHLCFADDLIIFSHRDLASVMIIKLCL